MQLLIGGRSLEEIQGANPPGFNWLASEWANRTGKNPVDAARGSERVRNSHHAWVVVPCGFSLFVFSLIGSVLLVEGQGQVKISALIFAGVCVAICNVLVIIAELRISPDAGYDTDLTLFPLYISLFVKWSGKSQGDLLWMSPSELKALAKETLIQMATGVIIAKADVESGWPEGAPALTAKRERELKRANMCLFALSLAKLNYDDYYAEARRRLIPIQPAVGGEQGLGVTENV